MAWRVARALDKLLAQINAYAPHRSKASDGSIGDTAHSARVSDHNPDSRGIVHARDFTHDPKGGFDAHAFARRLANAGDRRIRYLISSRRISNPLIGGGRWRPYSGANPHDKHAHVSCVYGALEDNTAAWPGLGDAPTAGGTTTPSNGGEMIKSRTIHSGTKPAAVSADGYRQTHLGDGKTYTLTSATSHVIDVVSHWAVTGLPTGAEMQVRYVLIEYHNWKAGSAVLKRGSKGDEVGALQRWLGIKDDDVFGADTEKAVRDWQARAGLTVDGAIGNASRAVLPTNRRVTTYNSQVQELVGTAGKTFGATTLRAWPAKAGQDRRLRVEVQAFVEGVTITSQEHRVLVMN